MITKALLKEWRACWDDDRLNKGFGRRKAVTPLQVAKAKDVSLDDKLWVLARVLWYLDESAARGFAIECALSVAHLAGDEDDQAHHLGLLGWLCEIEDLPEGEQRDAARSAAYAARSAANAANAANAARSAAYAAYAARSAAYAAYATDANAANATDAYDAANAAAYAAAYADAARSAAREASLKKSIDRALEWLGDYANGWES